jgi:DNA-binding LytR/AlgR family response regulator
MKPHMNLFASDLESLKLLMEEMPVAIGIAEIKSGGAPSKLVQPEAEIVYYNRRWRETFGFDVADVITTAEATRRLYPDPAYRAKVIGWRNRAVSESMHQGTPTRTDKISVRVADGTTRLFLTGTTVIGNRFMVSMEEITESAHGSGKRVLSVSRSGSSEHLLEIGTIAAVVADRKYSVVLSGTKEYPDRRSIGEWEELLAGEGFERIDRSTLIKIPWIYAMQSLGRGARISFAHAAVTLQVGRTGRERLAQVLS